MITRWTQRTRRTSHFVKRIIFRKHSHASVSRYGAVSVPPNADSHRTRNIGIIAHIDAGKTTTTERMLYYSGYTRRIGDVDEGSTVTDFLPAERARGITIQSAAITFHWPPPSEASNKQSHIINLIDTPGHADFTFEVLRSLRILDGAVCILDGVAGVEAQTEKVWVQANSYSIPKIVYVNKLDRAGAAFSRTVKEIGLRLHGWPAVCQIPWWKGADRKFVGLGDVIYLQGLLWEEGDGKAISVVSLEDLKDVDQTFAAEIAKARIALVELLSEHDDELVEKYLEYDEDHLKIPAVELISSLRRCLLRGLQRVIPVYAGASFRNIGVQPLLDAIVDLLPSPDERPDPEVSLGPVRGGLSDLTAGKIDVHAHGVSLPQMSKQMSTQKSSVSLPNLEACGLAFKVVNDARRGVLVYVRVYQGVITRNALLYNTNLLVSERVPRLLKMYASDAAEIDSIPAGQIGVIVGLKHARTGDTLIAYTGMNPKTGPPTPLNTLQLRPIAVPPPVFFTSVEPNSLSEQKHVHAALALLLREDPSLSVSMDPESGQTQLAGMGELHLEIARDRLIKDFKAKATPGKIEIGYREAILAASPPCTEHFDREVAGKQAEAACTASIAPAEAPSPQTQETEHIQHFELPDANTLSIHHPTLLKSGKPLPETPPLPPGLPLPAILHALKTGVSVALSRGPIHRFPVHSSHIHITFDPATSLFPTTTPAALSSAARLAVQSALKAAATAGGGTVLMEPVMMVTISVDEASLGAVVHDISSARGGQVISLDASETASSSSSSSTSEAIQTQEDLPVIDPRKIYAPPDPFAPSSSDADDSGALMGGSGMRQITARVPLKEMVGYLKHLRSLTGGRGTFVMSVDRFARMGAQRQRVALGEMSGGSV